MDLFDQLKRICFVLGKNPSADQVQNLNSWILENVPMDEWAFAAEVSGVDELYTDMRMRQAENGIY